MMGDRGGESCREAIAVYGRAGSACVEAAGAGHVGPDFDPYVSPIFLHSVAPLKTGKSKLRLQFANVCHAQGVQDFKLDLQILHRAAHHLLARLDYGPTVLTTDAPSLAA